MSVKYLIGFAKLRKREVLLELVPLQQLE